MHVNYQQLLEFAGDLPVVESASLRAAGLASNALAVQLSRWVEAGKLVQLTRGTYLLPERLRRNRAPVETIANLLHAASYVSLERALSIHQLIPEAVPLIQSITTGRPQHFSTPVGDFDYRHVKPSWFFGYLEMTIGDGRALVATPEKALLDLFYLSRGEFIAERLVQLRLQNTESLNVELLARFAARAKSPKVERAVRHLIESVKQEQDWQVVTP